MAVVHDAAGGRSSAGAPRDPQARGRVPGPPPSHRAHPGSRAQQRAAAAGTGRPGGRYRRRPQIPQEAVLLLLREHAVAAALARLGLLEVAVTATTPALVAALVPGAVVVLVVAAVQPWQRVRRLGLRVRRRVRLPAVPQPRPVQPALVPHRRNLVWKDSVDTVEPCPLLLFSNHCFRWTHFSFLFLIFNKYVMDVRGNEKISNSIL